ncbi:FG-GAP repeat protein [Kineococcus glutinatus]|uniref:FG-GAP repeat protein n=1 Tax=Kineococcus glutinatus TaxID=1070872 RepID=A0ABP9I6T2_9ACTN
MSRTTRTRPLAQRLQRTPAAAVAVGALATCLAGVAAAPAAFAGGGQAFHLSSDFNGDGYEDLAVGAPTKTWGGVPQTGVVTVSYGGPQGPGIPGTQLWWRGAPDLAGGAYGPERFGTAIAAGDFDDDGYADLAVGSPGKHHGNSSPDAGGITVIMGSAAGLTPARSREIYQGFGANGTMEDGDRFGASLVAGDFNRDGTADLAVGAPGETTTQTRDGAVHVLYGIAGVAGEPQFTARPVLDEGHPEVPGFPAAGAGFGAALATGDVTGDTYPDLLVGAPGAQHFTLLPGDPGGVTLTGAQRVAPADLGESPSPGFGGVLAVGNFGRTHHADVAIGRPSVSPGGITAAGAVLVAFGEPGRVGTSSTQHLRQGSPWVGGNPAPHDRFGWSLVAGRFGHDGYDDLAVGAFGEDSGGVPDAGAVHVLYGHHHGLRVEQPSVLQQGAGGAEGAAQAGDGFGDTLGAGDFDRDGRDDLVVGVFGERVGNEQPGAVQLFRGAAGSVTPAGDQLWSFATFAGQLGGAATSGMGWGRGLVR